MLHLSIFAQLRLRRDILEDALENLQDVGTKLSSEEKLRKLSYAADLVFCSKLRSMHDVTKQTREVFSSIRHLQSVRLLHDLTSMVPSMTLDREER